MLITDRLAKDLGQLLERELTRENGNAGNLEIALLLLIGWRREVARKGKPTRFTEPEDDLLDEEGSGGDDLEEDEDAPDNPDAFVALKGQAVAFCYGNPYLRGLLFQDFQADPGTQYQDLYLGEFGRVRIHTEAVRYVDEVLLMRPVELARTKGDEPTNAHLLLQRLCRLAAAPGDWAETAIRRRLEAPAGLDATWFRKTAKALRVQREREDKNGKVSATARNRRELSGPYWLHAGPCAEKTGEELDLRDVVEIAPKPLPSGFSADAEAASLLQGVVGVLNTRYRLLRTCGLLPEKWLERDEPGINRLKDLAQLRREAVKSAHWQANRPEQAFEEAFGRLLKDGGKLAGFSRFRRPPEDDPRREREIRERIQAGIFEDKEPAWLDSEEGYDMLARAHDPQARLADLLYDADEGDAAPDLDIADSADTAGGVQLSISLAEILADAGPRLLANPVLHRFYQAVLVDEEAFDALREEPDFQALLARDRRYAGLDAAGLGERLHADVRGLMIEVLLETADEPAAPALAEFMRWHMVEGKPLRGKDGLFNRKSFKTLLAADARWNALDPEALAETLNAEAFNLLRQLFGG